MNLSDLAIVFSISATMLTGGGVAGDYYLSHTYVSAESLIARDIRELNSEIREMEYDRDHGGLSDKNEWLLGQLYGDLEELEAQLE